MDAPAITWAVVYAQSLVSHAVVTVWSCPHIPTWNVPFPGVIVSTSE